MVYWDRFNKFSRGLFSGRFELVGQLENKKKEIKNRFLTSVFPTGLHVFSVIPSGKFS